MLITVKNCSLLNFFTLKFVSVTFKIKKMKKSILTLAAIFAFGFANAQDSVQETSGFATGDKFVEGSFSYSSNDKTGEASISDSWSLSPTFGYFLTDKWAVGGKLNFAGTKANNDDKTSTFGVTGFARYYFLTLGESKSFNAYGEAGLGYSAVTDNPNVGGSSTNSDFNANIDLGINYFFTSHWAATFELANILSYNNANPESGSNTSDLNVNVNLFNNLFAQPKFGLLYKW